MALTRDFKQTIVLRAKKDPDFRRAMLVEAIDEFLADHIDIAKSILRDYINATMRFEPLAKKLRKNSKSLQRMLSSAGNPTTNSLFAILHTLQKKEGIKLGATLK